LKWLSKVEGDGDSSSSPILQKDSACDSPLLGEGLGVRL